MASEEEDRDGSSILYKMKVVQTLGRSVPIILQNDNGPCPLLAISNVLLLRNNVNLNLDMTEISQRQLLFLVAGWLLDANSNLQNKTDEYVKNQQQNIDDAISLLPRLATGIDVNVRFRHIHDFEFTPESAIFDLFHVGLVHGWLCDPQDKVTYRIIGANSYNTLVEKLVAFHALKEASARARAEKEASARALAEEEPTVDLAAATTATLGVPRPILLKNLSNVSSISNVSSEYLEPFRQDIEKPRRKGDDEEHAELLQALQLSQSRSGDSKTSEDASAEVPLQESSEPSRKGDDEEQAELLQALELSQTGTETHNQMEDVGGRSIPSESVQSRSSSLSPSEPEMCSPDEQGQSASGDVTSLLRTTEPEPVPEEKSDSGNWVESVDENCNSPSVVEEETTAKAELSVAPTSGERKGDFARTRELSMAQLSLQPIDGGSNSVESDVLPLGRSVDSSASVGEGSTSPSARHESYVRSPGSESNVSIFALGEDVKTAVDPLDLDSDDDITDDQHERRLSPSESMSPRNYRPASECASSGIDEDEPLYEGEVILAGSAATVVGSGEKAPVYAVATNCEDKEPMYEGEVVLATQVHGEGESSANERYERERQKEHQTREAIREGMIIDKFLNDTASQLTYHGLFSLQEELKENELYVFFRNNHFSTIFKHEGQIYLLATDQGYLNQPDLVWEKLSEVDGNSSFYTGNFQLFEVDQSSGSWNEQDAVAATAEYISSQHTSGGGAGGGFDADYQLAMHLQREELAQQQQQQQQQQVRSPSPPNPRLSQQSPRKPGLGATRLVTGPSRSSVPPPTWSDKAKDKCTIM